MSSKKCARCGLVNFVSSESCKRCGTPLTEQVADETQAGEATGRSILKRALVVLAVTCSLLFVFYLSLLMSSNEVGFEQKRVVDRAIKILEQNGFGKEVFALRHLANYRATDNWWNRWVGHKEAYAATNFPFEVLTLYPEFFNDSTDDVERAAILLHESYHLYGSGETAALEGTWRDKSKIGWTADKYSQTKVWKNTLELTLSHVPGLFRCGDDGQTNCYQ